MSPINGAYCPRLSYEDKLAICAIYTERPMECRKHPMSVPGDCPIGADKTKREYLNVGALIVSSFVQSLQSSVKNIKLRMDEVENMNKELINTMREHLNVSGYPDPTATTAIYNAMSCFECKNDDCIDCHARRKQSERGREYYQRNRERILAKRKGEDANAKQNTELLHLQMPDM